MASKQWEQRGVALTGAPGGQTAARVPQLQKWVGWMKSKRKTVGSPNPPSLFFSLLIHSVLFQALHYCLPWQTAAGGAPLLVFVQPVRELFGPSDLSITPPRLKILSPFALKQKSCKSRMFRFLLSFRNSFVLLFCSWSAPLYAAPPPP